MKLIYTTLILLTSFSLSAQIIDDSVPIESVEMEEVIEKKLDEVDEAKKAFKDAQDDYKNAQKDLNDARKEEMKADNALQKARMAVRQAKLGLNMAEKKANPITIERYEVNINPTYEEMSKGMNHGLSTFIEGSETSGLFNVFSKNVDKEFKAYMKQFNSSKVKKQKGELFFDNIMIPEMSQTTMDLFVDFVEQENGVSIRTYFNDGAEFMEFTDEDELSTRYLTRMMDEFARYMRTKNLEGELENLEKELDKNFKNLEGNKGDIADARESIQDAKAEMTEKTNEISGLENTIDDLNDKLEIVRMKLSKVN